MNPERQLYDPVLRSIAENTLDVIMLLDHDQRIQYINRTAEGLTIEQVLGTQVYAWVPDDQHPDMIACFHHVQATRQGGRYENLYTAPGGQALSYESRVGPVIEDGVVTGFVVVSSDVTAQRLLERQLRQSQKMEAVGQLAGGVAHDFNNLVQSILINAEFAARLAVDQPELLAHLADIEQASERAAALTRQLLTFSRDDQPTDFVEVRLDELCAGSIQLLRRLIPANIRLTCRPSEDLTPVRADPGQLEQVLVNLCINARDAMPEGGELTIEACDVEVDDAFRDQHPWAKEERYVRLAVSDDGAGMAQRVRDRVFEPFFTTKAPGQGSGLGLAMVYGIVRHHGGGVSVWSEPGRGSRFEVHLPAHPGMAPQPVRHEPETVARGTGTLLVAEDDELVRKVAVACLESAGYTVLQAADGQEALALLDQHGDEVRAAVLDVVMPRLGGPEAAARLRQQRPDLPLVFCTGYADPERFAERLPPDSRIVRKPYRTIDLLRAVRDALPDP